jgi:hypothetical protein
MGKTSAAVRRKRSLWTPAVRRHEAQFEEDIRHTAAQTTMKPVAVQLA